MPLTENELNEINTILGRVDAIHAFCCVLARSLPAEIAQRVEKDFSVAVEKVDADAVALPIPEAHLHEMTRVLQELQHILRSASQGRQ